MTSEQPVRVDYSAQFQKDLKKLHRKYPHIRDDLQPVIGRLENGETPGDQVPGIERAVYKVRLRSTDQRKGKRGGFRMLYYLKISQFVALVTIYAKSAHSDLSATVIKRIVEEYESSSGN